MSSDSRPAPLDTTRAASSSVARSRIDGSYSCGSPPTGTSVCTSNASVQSSWSTMLAQTDVVATTTGRSSSADAGAEASASGAPTTIAATSSPVERRTILRSIPKRYDGRHRSRQPDAQVPRADRHHGRRVRALRRQRRAGPHDDRPRRRAVGRPGRAERQRQEHAVAAARGAAQADVGHVWSDARGPSCRSSPNTSSNTAGCR